MHLHAQLVVSKIDTSNYYQYQASPVKGGFVYLKDKSVINPLKGTVMSTAWLTRLDVTQIIVQELKYAGYTTVFDSQLYKVADNQFIVVTALCENPRFGILYVDGHYAFPDVKQRNGKINLHDQKNKDGSIGYREMARSAEDSAQIHIEKVPSNIKLLFENVYWYQYTDDEADDQFLVTKDIATEILRKDIRAIIKKAPKPVKNTANPFVIINGKLVE